MLIFPGNLFQFPEIALLKGPWMASTSPEKQPYPIASPPNLDTISNMHKYSTTRVVTSIIGIGMGAPLPKKYAKSVSSIIQRRLGRHQRLLNGFCHMGGNVDIKTRMDGL
ncbi:hypothetical protein H2248_008906 [Termitomyces sp. 'cryptogamus']|nr:hypothetical protein H2248_008906 [Termitomyces sp. 'cryptogamus']